MPTKFVLSLLFVLSVGVIALTITGRASLRSDGAPRSVAVLVAATALSAGTVLQPGDLRWQVRTAPLSAGVIARPADGQVFGRSLTEDADLAKVYGAALEQPVGAGEPVLSTAIVGPQNQSFLAVALAPGSRAFSFDVAAGGGAARIYPGDHVDVLLTQSFQSSDAAHRSASETVAANLRVLTIDLGQLGPPSDQRHSITLEVSPKQAEALSVAKELGKLSVVLRGGRDSAADDTTLAPTWANDVSSALRFVRPAAVPVHTNTIRVMRGAVSQDLKQE
jgi:pilus assembly protein CpaB